MRTELRTRRRETYKLLYRYGLERKEVVSRLAAEYDVSESAISKDIERMGGWITDLDVLLSDGLFRVLQVRRQAQDLEQMALQAQRDGDLVEARRAREAIVSAVQTEDKMARRLGLTVEEPYQFEELSLKLDPEDEKLVDEWSGVEESVDLDEMR